MSMSDISLNNIMLDKVELIPILSNCAISRKPISEISQMLNEAATDDDSGNIFMRMFYIFSAMGQNESALDMQVVALENRSIYRIVSPEVTSIRLLALMGPGDMSDNTPIDYLIENSDIRLDLLFISDEGDLPHSIPDHDVAFIALGESDKNNPLLERIGKLLLMWPRPFINHPDKIKNCARHKLPDILKNIPGLLVPKTVRVCRENLGECRFPITIRPIDTHSGIGFEKLDNFNELKVYLANSVNTEFYVSEFIDYQSTDGNYRKLRIALIDRKPYICHQAISEQWMVHYMSSGMELSEFKRKEEQWVMENFDLDFALRHGAALFAIAERFELDYVVIDCAQSKDGELILFEVDTRCWVHATDSVEIFPYKLLVMQKVFNAFRNLLLKKSSV